MKKLLYTLCVIFFLSGGTTYAQYIQQGQQGGTGIGGTTDANIGNCLKVLDGTPILIWTIGACGSGGGGGGSVFPFDTTSWGASTSTTLGFFNGFLSNASSTINAPLRLTGLSGALYAGTGGLVGVFPTTTASCSGDATCTPFVVIGNTPVDISATAGAGAVDGTGFAGMMTSWIDANSVTSTSTILGALFIATSTKASQFPNASTTQLTVGGPMYDFNNSPGTGGFVWMSRGNGLAPAWSATTTPCTTCALTSLTLTAGAGLTGGGDLSANRTFTVGAGTGITVNADDVALTIPVVVSSGGTGLTAVGASSTVLITNGSAAFWQKLAGSQITNDVPFEVGLTAGDGLTRTADDFDCDISSASVFGCLAAASFSKFNSASSTFSTGVTYTPATNAVTCDISSASVFGCLAAASFSKFNSATTTFSTGLTYTAATNAVTVNTSQNIATLSNLTTNGFITTAGGAGTLGVQQFPVTIAQGGTNSTSQIQGTALWFNGTSIVATSSALTVGSLIATTTTATSTFFGTLSVGSTTPNKEALFSVATSTDVFTISKTTGNAWFDNGVLYVDSVNNRVGISSTSPGTLFGINGVANFQTGTSTFQTGINLMNGGCFAISGACVGGGSGSGTVTSVATNNGLTGGTITTTGTLGLDTTAIVNGLLLQYNGTRLAATGTQALTAGYFIATSTTASQFKSATTTSFTSTDGTFLATGGADVTVGTTTSTLGEMEIYTITEPHECFSVGGGVPAWCIRVLNDGSLHYATTTTAGSATSTPSAIVFNPTGLGTFVGGTTTNAAVSGLAVRGTMFIDPALLTTQSGAGNTLCLTTVGQVVQDDSPITSCSGASSIRYKDIVGEIESPLDKVRRLNPIAFRYKPDSPQGNDQKIHLGFIAEELAEIEPRLVEYDKQGLPENIEYQQVTALLAGAIQELDKKQSGGNWGLLGLFGLLGLIPLFRKKI